MKNIIVLGFILCLVGVLDAKAEDPAESELAVGKSIFDKRSCAVCHDDTDDQRRYDLGPSWKQIAEAYEGSHEDMTRFLRGEREPIVDKAKFPMMHGQIILLKTCSDSEKKALGRFIVEQKLSPHRK